LEERRLLAVTAARDAAPNTDVLLINLGAASDTAVVRVVGGNIIVKDGAGSVKFTQATSTGAINKIIVDGTAAADQSLKTRDNLSLIKGTQFNSTAENAIFDGKIKGVTTGNAITISADTVEVNADFDGAGGDVSFTSNVTDLSLKANILTNGGTVTFRQRVDVLTTVTIDTDKAGGNSAAGNVTFNASATAEGPGSLKIDTSADGTGNAADIEFRDMGTNSALSRFEARTNKAGKIIWKGTAIATDGDVVFAAPTLEVDQTNGTIDSEANLSGVGGAVNLAGVVLISPLATPLPYILTIDTTNPGNADGTVTLPGGPPVYTEIIPSPLTGFRTFKNGAADTVRIQIAGTGGGIVGGGGGVVGGSLLFSENFNAPLVNPNLASLVTKKGTFTQVGNAYSGTRLPPTGKAIATIDSLTTAQLTSHYEVKATVTLTPVATGLFSNGFIIFDYQDPLNFKYAGIFVGRQTYAIGQVSGGNIAYHTEIPATISAGTPVDLRLDINGTVVTLFNGATQVATRTYTTAFTGKVGIGTNNANTIFDNLEVRTV